MPPVKKSTRERARSRLKSLKLGYPLSDKRISKKAPQTKQSPFGIPKPPLKKKRGK